MVFRRQWLLALSFLHCLVLAEYVHKGCYDTHGLNLKSQGQYEWQSLSYCQQHCGGSPIVAMRNGGECLCGDSLGLLSSASLTPGLCNVRCNGWAYQSCGGNSSVDVYVDSSRPSHSHGSASSNQVTLTNTLSSASSSLPSTIDSGSSDSSFISSSSSSSPISSVEGISTSDSGQSNSFVTSYYRASGPSFSQRNARVSKPTASQTSSSTRSEPASTVLSSSVPTSISLKYLTTVIPTLITKNNRDETVFLTTTALPTPYGNMRKTTSNDNGGLGGGAIAGIVVGVVIGVLIIIVGAGFYLWRRHQLNQEPDLEETKHYQPYSFGDADAMSVDSGSKNDSIWRKGSSATRASSHESAPTGFLSDSISKGSLNSLLMTEDTGVNYMRPHMPSTVLEEPPSIYSGTQRFSTGSINDMTQDGNLRVANPDGENNRYSQRNFDDVEEDDYENMFSSSSSGGSYHGQEPKSY